MGHRYARRIGILLLALRGAIASSSEDWLSELPSCGVGCLNSPLVMTSCLDAEDTACFCPDSVSQHAVKVCLFEQCEPLEAIEGAKIQAEACPAHVRSRKRQAMIALAAEVPAFFSPWLRLYSRWISHQGFAIDDYLMLVCGVLFTAFVVLGQLVSGLAFGQDIWQVEASSVTFALKVFYVDESLYIVCLGLTKISVLTFYLRLFPYQSFRYAAQITTIFIVASTTLFTFLQIFQCSPIDFVWEGWKNPDQDHRCFELNTLTYAAAGTSIVQDMIILLLPLPFLAKLNTGLKTKLGIMLLFSLGIFVLATSMIRLHYFTSFGRSPNPTWDYTDALIWTGLEVSISIIVACLPPIRALFKHMRRDMARLVGGRTEPSKRPRSTYPRGLGNCANSLELGLELGDKIRGDVQTEILAVKGPVSPAGAEEGAGGNGGIHVTTTTTSTVALSLDEAHLECLPDFEGCFRNL